MFLLNLLLSITAAQAYVPEIGSVRYLSSQVTDALGENQYYTLVDQVLHKEKFRDADYLISLRIRYQANVFRASLNEDSVFKTLFPEKIVEGLAWVDRFEAECEAGQFELQLPSYS